VHADAGPVRIAVPRDRAGSFEPLVVPKHARRQRTERQSSIVPRREVTILHATGYGGARI
jgi:transposase-like protein